jgi:hypothetical protein
MATNPIFAGGEAPTSLTYPAASAADQAFGGQALDATSKQYLFLTAAVPLVTAGYQASLAQCQLADGTRAGFVDTTYAPTAAQVLYGVGHHAY